MIKIGHSEFKEALTDEQLKEYAIVLWLVDGYFDKWNDNVNYNGSADELFESMRDHIERFRVSLNSVTEDIVPKSIKQIHMVQYMIDNNIKVNKSSALYKIMADEKL